MTGGSHVVACTDYFVERTIEARCGAAAPVIIRAFAARLRQDRIRSAAPVQASAAVAEVPRSAGVVLSRDYRAGAGRIDFRPHVRPRFELRLGYAGIEAIRRELGWGALEGVETGGYLWSHLRAQDRGVVVAYVSPPADGSRHGAHAVQLGRPESIVTAWPDWLRRSEMVVVGCWHSHPQGDGKPSPVDREAWATRVEVSGSAWASLIVTRGADGAGWSAPRLHGWVTSSDGRGGAILEPALVNEP
jgi:hypothetical protein